MKKHLKTVLIIAAVACLLLAISKAGSAARTLPESYSLLGIAFALYLIHYFFQAIGWHFILRGMGHQAPFATSVRMWYGSLIARWLPGPFLAVTRVMVAKDFGVPIAAGSFAVLLEFGYVVVGAVLVSTAFAFNMFTRLVSHGHATGSVTQICYMILMMVVGGLILRPSALRSIFKSAKLRRILSKASGSEIDWEHVPAMSTGTSMLLVLYYSFFWTFSGFMFYVMALAFSPAPIATAPAYISAFPASWIIGYLAIVAPAGIGVREAAMTFMLAPVTSSAVAITLAVWSRILMMGAEILSVAVAYAFNRKLARVGNQPIETASQES